MNTVVQITTGHASEGGHWYTQTGVPAYEVENKSKGGWRKTTLRDAKQLGLVPSVSGIINQLDKPGLRRWQETQVLMSACTLPRLDGETVDAFMERARADAKEQATRAAELGTAIHKAIDEGLSGKPFDPELEPYVSAVEGFLMERFPGANKGRCEVPFAHWWGYGGKVDWTLDNIVIDFKTCDVGLDADPATLAREHRHLQLVAYAWGLGIWEPRLLNVFISTRTGHVMAHEYPIAKYAQYRQWFYHLLKAWQAERNYFCGWDPDEFAYEAGDA